MDQFSHDLTVALEETSLLDRARVCRWGQQRRRTRSTGNLPCAPQPTEDSSSPTDIVQCSTVISHTTNNNDGLDTHNINLPASDSDDNYIDNDLSVGIGLRLPNKIPLINANNSRLGTLESDSLNETFSPARFFKPNARRKRKMKRITMDYEMNSNLAAADNINIVNTMPSAIINSNCALSHSTNATTPLTSLYPLPSASSYTSGTMRKRLLRSDSSSRSQLFFCGKRKRSNRDRYHDHGSGCVISGNERAILNNMSRPCYHTKNKNHNSGNLEELRMRSRSFSSTVSKPPTKDRLLPLNKGLLSKIERISQQQQQQEQQQQENNKLTILPSLANEKSLPETISNLSISKKGLVDGKEEKLTQQQPCDEQRNEIFQKLNSEPDPLNLLCQQQFHHNNHTHRKFHHQRQRRRLLQFPIDDTNLMDCEDLHGFSSSSLSSSESDNNYAINDTDREGDDELTDWPGNEFGSIAGNGIDYKRKLTKRSTLPQIKSDPESLTALIMTEDDTLMSQGANISLQQSLSSTPIELPYQTSEPITITSSSNRSLSTTISVALSDGEPDNRKNTTLMATAIDDINIPVKQIESEMSGETSTNPFLSSPPCQVQEVREIRAGCRRIKSERPGFSIKTSVNERLARFLQDPRQLQIRLPDIEIYEHDSLINLATLYSLNMSSDNGCVVLNKTSNTTQSIHIDRQSLKSRLLLSDFKRRCYENECSATDLLHK